MLAQSNSRNSVKYYRRTDVILCATSPIHDSRRKPAIHTIKIYKYRQNTTKFIIFYHFWTTCFYSLESSSGPLVN